MTYSVDLATEVPISDFIWRFFSLKILSILDSGPRVHYCTIFSKKNLPILDLGLHVQYCTQVVFTPVGGRVNVNTLKHFLTYLYLQLTHFH